MNMRGVLIFALSVLGGLVRGAATEIRHKTPPKKEVTREDLEWRERQAALYYKLTCMPMMGASAREQELAYAQLDMHTARLGKAPAKRMHKPE